jgi:hypothetical protein
LATDGISPGASAGINTTKTAPSYVLIADIVDLPRADRGVQVEWMAQLLGLICDATPDTLSGLNIFPTGTGLMLSIYPEDPRGDAALALDLARDLLRANACGEFKLRVTINYSGAETLLELPGELGAAHASHVQVGNGIAIAERLIHFAEPNEILVSGDYWSQLRAEDLLADYGFDEHLDSFVPDVDTLEFFSYRPSDDERDCIYGAKQGEQHLRKFAYFPPLRTATVARFRDLSFREDLEQLCSYAYDTVDAVNRSRMFISWSSVYDVLLQVPCQDGEEVLVLSRADLKFDFWSTAESYRYLRQLRVAQRRCRRATERIFLYDRDREEPPAEPDVLSVLHELHEEGTLRKIDVAYARRSLLMNYRFGVTIFPRLKCAVAPIPAAESYGEYLELIRYAKAHDAAYRFPDADFANSKFKALVVADEEQVTDLEMAFAELKEHPSEAI